MRKIVIILSAFVLISGSCGQTVKAQTIMAEESTISKLQEKHRYFIENQMVQEDYYANVDYIGLGIVNPKDFQLGFQLTTEIPDRKKIEIVNIEEQELLIPLFWKPDYSLFYMTVVEISEDQYRVQANNEMTFWVDKNEFDFYTWEDLLKNLFAIEADIVYKEKDIHSQATIEPSLEEDFFFTVQKVEGDWIYIRVENYHTEEIKGYYWTRWKDENNKLLIRLYFFA